METVIRITIIYILILIGLRVMGKREFSQMSPLELVSLLLIPEVVAQSLVGEDFSLTNGIIGLSTLFLLVMLNSLLMHKFKWYEEAVASKPEVLVLKGKYLNKAMNENRINPDDIFQEMHKIGLEKLKEVKWAILETDGKISIVPHASITSAGKAKSKQMNG